MSHCWETYFHLESAAQLRLSFATQFIIWEKNMTEFTGGCLCGAIQYQVSGGPETAYSCHCRDCQYLTGGAPNNAIYIPQASLKIIQGEPHAYNTTSDSGTRATRFFCHQCGTHLYGKSELFKGSVVLKVGSLDDPSLFKPTMNVWVSSAQHWHNVDRNLPSYDKAPEE